jgi:hypothetical protein
MTNEERDLIARFVQRVGGGPAPSGFGASVPATRPNLPPIDPEADRFLADQFQQYPEARYRVTQLAVVQEAALGEAQNRIKRLEWELSQAQANAQSAPRSGGGLFGGLFGGGQRPQASPPGYGQPQQPGYNQPQGGYPPPQPQYAPNYQPGMFQRQGSGFLGSALTTAAGVAGGMVVGDALMNMFDGGHGGGLGGGFGGGGETIIENNYGDAGADPFAGGGADTGTDPWGGDQGGGDPFSGGGGGDDSLF